MGYDMGALGTILNGEWGTLPFAKSLLKEKYCGKVLAATKVPVQEFAKYSQLEL